LGPSISGGVLMENINGIALVIGEDHGELPTGYYGDLATRMQQGKWLPPSPDIFERDAVNGSTQPDDALYGGGLNGRAVHGNYLANVANTQTPLPVQVGGGSPLGPLGKGPATLGIGGDVVGAPYRQGRYEAIRNIHPESVSTIGSVARQSYQYVRPPMEMVRPYNAFPEEGNPILPQGGNSGRRTIDSTILPALEPPRHNLTNLDTDYFVEQANILDIKQRLAERGMR
jgi:hypothetical protein